MAVYADALRLMFPDLDPVVDDLFLLEGHQIAGLPERAPHRELAVVLRHRPDLVRFFSTRHPPIRAFLAGLVGGAEQSGPTFVEAADALVWEIADLIVYQRAPEMYDDAVQYAWDRTALAELEPLEGKTIVDGGAGTGHVTFAVAVAAASVFAVEPVASLRAYIRDKARRNGHNNVFVIDGLLSSIPLPDGSVDAIVTQRAIGWDLVAELDEIERVVQRGGAALHLMGGPFPADKDAFCHEELLAHGYEEAPYQDGESLLRKYSKQI